MGVNFLIVGAAQTRGGLSDSDDAPLQDAQLTVTGPLFAYARTLDIWGKAGKVDVIAPTGRLSGSAVIRGEPVSREVSGLGDPLMRFTVLLWGAPALSAAEFRTYRQDLVVGASVQLSVPLGQYDNTRLINLGANRWFVKPEVGISKVSGPWTVEVAASAKIFTANDDVVGGARRTQAPIFSASGHAIYSFRSGIWGSLDTTYYTGGQTSLNGVDEGDLQRNWRVGVTLAVPLTRRTAIKLNASRGVSARTRNNYDLIGVAWQYRWGAGL